MEVVINTAGLSTAGLMFSPNNIIANTFKVPTDKMKMIGWLIHSSEKCFTEPGETIENFIQSES